METVSKLPTIRRSSPTIKRFRARNRRPSWRCRWPSGTRWRWGRTAKAWRPWCRRRQSTGRTSGPFDEWPKAVLLDDWAAFLATFLQNNGTSSRNYSNSSQLNFIFSMFLAECEQTGTAEVAIAATAGAKLSDFLSCTGAANRIGNVGTEQSLPT